MIRFFSYFIVSDLAYIYNTMVENKMEAKKKKFNL